MPNIDEARHEYVEDTKLASREIEEHRGFLRLVPCERILAYRPASSRYHRLATVQTKLLTFHWISRSEKETTVRRSRSRQACEASAFSLSRISTKSYERKQKSAM